jgi:two-component system, NtrC family, sensor histidine kinase PilS
MRLPTRSTLPRELDPAHSLDEGLPRLWRAFMAARILVASVLLALMVYLHFASSSPTTVTALALCGTYLLLTLWVRIWGKPERSASQFDPQWLVTVGADVLVFSLLLYLQIGGFNFTPLYVLPVLLAAILGPLLLALGTAAAVTLALLVEAWQLSVFGLEEATPRFLQAALTGTGLFVVAYLANQLATRLARQERIAHTNAMAARAQTQVNQLVVDALSDGVLVVDAAGVVRTANPAARSMLGPRTQSAGSYDSTAQIVLLPNMTFMLASHAAWKPLVDLASATLSTLQPQDAEVAITDTAGATHRLRVRTQLAAGSRSGLHDADTLCVLFLEDLREMEARLRNDKLAAMGRMSAAVAHEIRNPLAAIAQANALLAEDLVLPAQQKLSLMVQHNAKRLGRIVDDVLDVSRVTPSTAPGQIVSDAERTIISICRDWGLQNACGEQLRIAQSNARNTIVFDEEHLRRILVNLLDNALRYASKRPDAIEVFVHSPDAHEQRNNEDAHTPSVIRLAVWSDAAPIEQGVQRHLFEPFFSSESRSSGLGLYICRELCARHGATIGYQRSERSERGGGDLAAVQAGNEFYVLLNIAANLPQALPRPL